MIGLRGNVAFTNYTRHDFACAEWTHAPRLGIYAEASMRT